MSIEKKCDRCDAPLGDGYIPQYKEFETSYGSFDKDLCDNCKYVIRELCDKYMEKRNKQDAEFEESLFNKGDTK